ncbi:hypothetical protein BD413DRAFT_495995 [Trametes elegans]|nr:hypothetical protein BD413DRAFT_495995 [Trametes elegans]
MFGFSFVLGAQALLVSLAYVVNLVLSQSTVQTFFPAAIPLTDRSPYLSVWQSSTNGSAPLSRSWPKFWNQLVVQVQRTGTLNMGWVGKMKVDGQTYSWLGNDPIPENTSGNVTNVRITPTRSIFVMQAGPMNVTITFLSPIESPMPFKEDNEQAQDGLAYYAMKQMSGLTWQIDRDNTVRGQFGTQGTLTNSDSRAFATIEPIYTVYAIAVDLGQIQNITQPVTWAIGYVRDPSIQYSGPDGSQRQLHPYYVTKYSAISTAIDAVISEADDALQRATALDQAIMGNACQISSRYADLVALSARQTMGSLDITVQDDASANPDPSQVRIFMKDMGFSGNKVPNTRSRCPILALTVSALSYNLTKQWADYLVNNSLTPNTQLSADNGGAANLTNLAIKGIIGVKAMAEISRAVGNSSDAQNYDNQATTLFNAWQSLALSSDKQHILGTYGSQQSWALMYNLYADLLLGTNLVNQTSPSTHVMCQTAFYKTLLSSGTCSVPVFGLAIDSETDQMASAAWTLFTAAIVQDNSARDILINSVWARATSNVTAGVFPSEYDPNTGSIVSNSQAG